MILFAFPSLTPTPPIASTAPVEEDDYYSSDDQEDYSDSDNEGVSGYRKGGYHPVRIGELYNERYLVLKKMGWGHFSTVWLCRDLSTEQAVAMKVQKSASHYTEAAVDEIKILEQIAKGDEKHEKFVVSMIDSFKHRGPHGLRKSYISLVGDFLFFF